MKDHYIISVVVTTYNAERTIKRALKSVLKTKDYRSIEIVVVDDCSNDKTYEEAGKMAEAYENIRLFRMEKNSGGPSAPRNLGIERALGKYITFLDDDDEINVDNLLKMVRQANNEKADFVKGYLIAVEAGKSKILNQMKFPQRDRISIIKNIVAGQSMNSDAIILGSWLKASNIRYRTDLKIGEDTVFLVRLLCCATKVMYLDNYFLIHNNSPLDISNLASTQNWGDREITHQITSWKEAEKELQTIGLSYYKLRLHVGFRHMLLSIVRYSNGISMGTYRTMSEFAKETKLYISKTMNLSDRYQELYDAILSGDYNEYCDKSKRRLLINGYDLKFILPVIKYIDKDFKIEVDEWTGHDSHDKNRSKKMAQWADIIWCEWLLGNAVYYSQMKNRNQRLIIRAHRFEISRDFGNKIDWNNVNMVFAVGYYYFEKFISRFSIPREKMHLLSNYVEDGIYSTEKSHDAKYNIGLVGVLPKRKGFLRGLQILEQLVKENKNYKLYIMGKSYSEVSWIKNNLEERVYYEECEKYIKEHNLGDNVVYGGFVKRQNLYNQLGYVLSLSDDEQPESFHLAPAESVCSGSMGLILRWSGVEYIYPQNVIIDSTEEMVNLILKMNTDDDFYRREVETLRGYILNHFSLGNFLEELKIYLAKIRIEG